jgi:hypothetical protein
VIVKELPVVLQLPPDKEKPPGFSAAERTLYRGLLCDDVVKSSVHTSFLGLSSRLSTGISPVHPQYNTSPNDIARSFLSRFPNNRIGTKKGQIAYCQSSPEKQSLRIKTGNRATALTCGDAANVGEPYPRSGECAHGSAQTFVRLLRACNFFHFEVQTADEESVLRAA